MYVQWTSGVLYHTLATQNSKEAMREQALAMLMMDLKRAEERADKEGWISAEELERVEK